MQKIIAVVAIVLLALSGIKIVSYVFGRNGPPDVSANRFAALGLGVAEEAARRLNGQGGILVIDSPDRPAGDELDQARLKAFRGTAEKLGLKIVAVEKLPQEMLQPAGIPSAYFSELLARHDGVDAIVSFGGAPIVKGSDAEAAGKMPPVFLGAGGYSDLKQLFQRGIVGFIVEPVYGTELADAHPETTREWFDTYFRVVTPEAIGSMPPAATP